MSRPKPYQSRESRAAPYVRSNPDAPGAWKHDLHPGGNGSTSGSSLAARISGLDGSSQPRGGRGGSALLGRISSHKGQELFATPTDGTSNGGGSQMYGFGATPPPNVNNLNSGMELFPEAPGKGGGVMQDQSQWATGPGSAAAGRQMGRSVYAKGLVDAGLGAQAEAERQRQREVAAIRERERRAAQAPVMKIAGQGKIWVRVENLAQGTTAEDVQSAFAPSPIISAKLSTTPTSRPDLVSIDLEYTDRGEAEKLVQTYNGVVADGNALKVGIVTIPLSGRVGQAGAAPAAGPSTQAGGPLGRRMGREPVQVPVAARSGSGASSGSKLYSDDLLASNPYSKIITVADDSTSDPSAADRSNAWTQSGGQPLSHRVGGGGGGRSGGRGGGSYGW